MADLTPVQKRARDLYATGAAGSNGVDSTGAALPQWADLPPATQGLWVAASTRAKQLANDNVADADEANDPPSNLTIAQLDIWRAYTPADPPPT